MICSRFYNINSFFLYIELNSYLVGTSISFFKYKFNSLFYVFVVNSIFYFSYFYLLEKKEIIETIWKNSKYLFFSFFKSNIFYNIKHLKLEGRGYKLYYYLNYVILKLGYSHLCYFLLPLNVYFTSRQRKSYYRLVSFSSCMIGNILFRMQCFRIPNKYKKKGIFIT